MLNYEMRIGHSFSPDARDIRWERYAILALLASLLLFNAGCGVLSRETSKTARTPIEQLLLSQAVERSIRTLNLPVPRDGSIAVEVTGLTPDQEFLRQVVSEQLARRGFRVVKQQKEQAQEQKPTYLVRIVLEGFGTEQGTTFFGMPAIQSIVIPFSLPPITLYQNVHQQGVVRFSLNIYNFESAQLLGFTRIYEASTHYNSYTLLIFWGWTSTDLDLPNENWVKGK